jgi:hypothetical protein
LPPGEAQKLVAQKSARSYTTAKRDILEASLRHLEQAAKMYDSLSRRASWATVECFDSSRSAMRTPQTIAADVLAVVEPSLTSLVTGPSQRSGQ